MALKLNLGCGDRPLPGFVNVDALPTAHGVDVVADISERLPFDDSSASLVYATHLLEHFPHSRSVDILKEWRRVLEPGGQLLVAVPDLLAIARILISKPGWFTPPHNPWLGVIYGGQKDEWDFHKAGFTEPWLAHVLGLAGFSDVERVVRFEEVGIADTSYLPLPFGTDISLNMRPFNGPALPVSLPPPTRLERSLSILGKGLEFGMRARSAAQSRLALRRLAKHSAPEGGSREPT
jgi:predicted SAM-dependent methyltransferase